MSVKGGDRVVKGLNGKIEKRVNVQYWVIKREKEVVSIGAFLVLFYAFTPQSYYNNIAGVCSIFAEVI